MGGDHGPSVTIPGVDMVLARHPNMRVLLFGDRDQIEKEAVRFPRVRTRGEIRHADVAIRMDDKPSVALRRGRRVSSMWMALEAVKNGEAAVAVSAGNTGALMAMSVFVLKTMEGIKRPAIACLWPTMRGRSVVLDVGATIGADAEQLVDFAIMGEAMARVLLGKEKPSVGLLNVGVEEIKGVEYVREAGRLLKEADLPIAYHGFVEGNDIAAGTVDVFVTEGFTGNIALKTAEGTARQVATILREFLSESLLARLGALLARRAFAKLRKRLDPRESNGGVFLGLNGVVIKSHGGTDAFGFANAIEIAVDMAKANLVEKIAADIAVKQALLAANGERQARAGGGG
jgi:glycerol-3-phosphate acyltransferase PlsX